MTGFVTVLDAADDPGKSPPITGKRIFYECHRVRPSHAREVSEEPVWKDAAGLLGGAHSLDTGNPVGEYPLNPGCERHG
jgi:hypothetical protein